MERSVQFVKWKSKMTGRPQFDDPAVVAAAMDVFWRHGYAASSISQLTAATGLSRSSLYQRFGDKEGLFSEALLKYSELVLKRMDTVRASSKREQVEALLNEFLTKNIDSSKPAGCLLVRTCAEMLDIPLAGRALAQVALAQQRDLIIRVLREAVDCKELSQTADLDALAWHFLGVLQSITNLPQAGATAHDLQRVVAMAMLAWPAPVRSNVDAPRRGRQ